MIFMILVFIVFGMIKVILFFCIIFNWLLLNLSIYRVLDIIGDVVFYFMFIIFVINVVKKFNVNILIVVIVVGVFLYLNFFVWVLSGDFILFIGVLI